MKEFIKDIKLENPVDDGKGFKANTIRIEVKHNIGGHSVFSDSFMRRGITCYVTPINIKDNSYSVLYDGKMKHQGYYVFLKEVGRRSEKQMQKFADSIFPKADEIANMFISGELQKSAKLILEQAQNVC